MECWTACGGRDSAVGIATHNGFDGLGFKPCPDRFRIPPSLLYSRYRLSFSGIKRPGRDVVHPPLSNAEAKERADLYLYPTPPPPLPYLQACYIVNFTFTGIYVNIQGRGCFIPLVVYWHCSGLRITKRLHNMRIYIYARGNCFIFAYDTSPGVIWTHVNGI